MKIKVIEEIYDEEVFAGEMSDDIDTESVLEEVYKIIDNHGWEVTNDSYTRDTVYVYITKKGGRDDYR